MRVVTLTGWGQPCDALASVAPAAAHLDYAALTPGRIVWPEAEVAVGWSLGGQLVARAISAGHFSPKKLVLIAAPYQFVESTPEGQRVYADFHGRCRRNLRRAMGRAWELVAVGDSKGEQIRAAMKGHDPDVAARMPWLSWLEDLGGFNCDSLAFDDFPPTLLIHGRQDHVVAYGQSDRFAGRLRHVVRLDLPHAGHAPHWHAPGEVSSAIEEFIRA